MTRKIGVKYRWTITILRTIKHHSNEAFKDLERFVFYIRLFNILGDVLHGCNLFKNGRINFIRLFKLYPDQSI
jgi:hypothetical protein